jgi:hypothetical protein
MRQQAEDNSDRVAARGLYPGRVLRQAFDRAVFEVSMRIMRVRRALAVSLERGLEEVFASQRDMLRVQGDAAASQESARFIPVLAAELHVVKDWLARQPGMSVLTVPYAEVVRDPVTWAREVTRFLGGGLDEAAMAAAVDPSLYRHRDGMV